MGERAFSKIQYGKETISNHGTLVAATKILNGGVIPIKPDRVPVHPEMNLGIRSRTWGPGMVYQTLIQDTLSIPSGYYQILPMFLSCGLKGNITAGEVTPAQSDYLWTFTPSEIASNTLDSVTLEMGDDVQEFEMGYTMFERLKFGGVVAQDTGESPVSIEGDFFARQLVNSTFTGSLALTTPEYINAKKTLLYVDTTWAGVGGTPIANILRAWDVEILTGVHPKFMGSGDSFFTTHGEGVIDVMANLTLEGTSAADSIWDAFIARTLQVIRLKVTGAQIGTGTTYSLIIDVSGYWDEVIPLSGEDKGNNLHTAMFRGVYDTTGAKKLALTVTTNASAL